MATFGNAETIAGTANTLSTDSFAANQGVGCRFTAPADCASITSLTAYVGYLSTANAKACVWTDASPGVLVANGVSGATAGTNGRGYYVFTFATPPTVTPNTVYRFGLVASVDIDFSYKAGAAAQQRYDSSNTYSSPGNLDATSDDANEDGWYMTYTPSGGGSSSPSALRAGIGSGIGSGIQ